MIKEEFGATNKDIWNYVAADDARVFMEVQEPAHMGVGPWIESETFSQWLDMLHKDIPVRTTMSEAMRKENMR